MATKFTYDYADRLLVISSSVVELDVQVDLYSDWKEDVISNVFNPGVAEPFRTTAGDPIGGGNQISPYFFLINGWQIRPHEADHTLTIQGNLFSDPAANNIVVPTLGDFTVNAILERAVDSTAILLEEPTIQHASFGGGVWVKPSSAFAGTDFPNGTLLQPINNVADALAIASLRGLPRLYILENVSFTNSESLSGLDIIGQVPEVSVTVSGSTSVDNTNFEKLRIFGEYCATDDCDTLFENCTLLDITYGGQKAEQISLVGTTFLTGSGPFQFVRMIDADPSAGAARFDLSGVAPEAQIAVRDYFGALEIVSCSVNVDMAMDIRGRAIFDSTVSTGSFRVRGIGQISNQSTGDTVVNDDDLLGKEVRAELDEIIISQSFAVTLTPSQSIMLQTIYDLMGLDPTKPLVVTPHARTVLAEISQSIDKDGDKVTVTRT